MEATAFSCRMRAQVVFKLCHFEFFFLGLQLPKDHREVAGQAKTVSGSRA